MRECRFVPTASHHGTGRRLERVLGYALDLVVVDTGAAPDAVAQRMIDSFKAYNADAEWLRFQWGPLAFFRDGHWLRPEAWPYDHARLARAREARVGVN